MARKRKASLLCLVAIGAGCGVLIGGLLAVGIAFLGDRSLLDDSGLGLMVSICLFALAGACYGYQACKETPVVAQGESDA